ncbi:hypothetical protein A1OE_1057 [Candidatus Endolissoclinum faulkneri L2]|uniref:Uncharacterized protein n=1 Tax=Candidatus Endolissoclinum faulkneri L2 TaxID=1193729 RepID=K7YI08_9PROT|nr:hypothetical protein A1OE_1057 [Candidatus Endolissoclinum faulkneri L2]
MTYYLILCLNCCLILVHKILYALSGNLLAFFKKYLEGKAQLVTADC